MLDLWFIKVSTAIAFILSFVNQDFSDAIAIFLFAYLPFGFR
ncbi:hypothetical protein [Aulosira sp. FACHB-615]|nr:hypothetical protein [Aulosira sp. FACHB-615]